MTKAKPLLSARVEIWQDDTKNPHDRFFKLGLDNRNVALQLMEELLPPAFQELCVLDQYELVKQCFVSPDLQESISDVLLKLPLRKGGVMYAFLLWEHFRKVDPLAAFRDWGYKHAIAAYHMRQTQSSTVPLIHTIVFYNGKRPYSAAQDYVDLVKAPKPLAEAMFTGYQLVNLAHMSDEEVAHRVWSGVFQAALKHIDNPKILEKLGEMTDHLREIGASVTGIELIGALINYILRAGKLLRPEEIIEKVRVLLAPEAAEVMVTLADQFIQKGVQQGVKKGETGLLKRMLRKGSSAETISNLTGISLLKIQAIEKELRDKSSQGNKQEP